MPWALRSLTFGISLKPRTSIDSELIAFLSESDTPSWSHMTSDLPNLSMT